MRHKLEIFTLIISLALVTLACEALQNISTSSNAVNGSGNVTSENRPVNGVHRVSLENQGDLTIEIGDTENLVVEAEANLLPYIETQVIGGELVIRTKNNIDLQNREPIRYHLTAKQVDALRITSSGNITAPELQAQSFSINISSSGDMNIAALSADRLTVGISSSGNVTINGGEVPELNVRISSSGDFSAENMETQSASIAISSSGDATVRVSGQLNANISSSGNVYYYGNPQLQVSSSSSGQAIQRGD
jgi:Putative auto-transporter adhesin, head GIN domain